MPICGKEFHFSNVMVKIKATQMMFSRASEEERNPTELGFIVTCFERRMRQRGPVKTPQHLERIYRNKSLKAQNKPRCSTETVYLRDLRTKIIYSYFRVLYYVIKPFATILTKDEVDDIKDVVHDEIDKIRISRGQDTLE